jgi:hypothetical protein
VSRRLAPVLSALVVASAWLVGSAGGAEVRAATPDLTIVSEARYDVQPDQRRVHVTVDLILANHLRDTRTKRFFFDDASLVVVPGASHPNLSWAGPGRPRASISRSTGKATTIRLDLGQRLYSGKSASYRLTFDVIDPGGSSTRPVRIGSSLVRFPVWAYASDDTAGSTVRVVFPAGFEATVASGRFPTPTTDAADRTVFQTARLRTPLTFFAYFVADRPGATTARTIEADVADEIVSLSVVSWADDPAWSKRVSRLVRQALPLLSERIGLPWPRDDGLVFREALGRSSGGYAGLYDPAAGTVDVAFDAGDAVVIHEAAHAWFDGALLADRWAAEGFASYYGADVAREMSVPSASAGAGVSPTLEGGRIALNAWGPPGQDDGPTDDYAYAASLALARAIAERAGPDALRAVWADASERVGAYQPVIPDGLSTSTTRQPEMTDAAPDWRGLLDLLEDRTGASFDDLWRTWVARDSDVELLDQRAAARAAYAEVLTHTGDWVLPETIRDAMRAWRFDEATSLMLDAESILVQRASIRQRSAAAGLTVPDTVRQAFERPDGFADAMLAASDESAALDHYAEAAALRPESPGLIEDIGLWGLTPDDDLARSRALFEEGDLAGSTDAATAAVAAWSGATEAGRGRLLSLGALGVAAILALVIVVVAIRGRRRPASAAWPTFDLDR